MGMAKTIAIPYREDPIVWLLLLDELGQRRSAAAVMSGHQYRRRHIRAGFQQLEFATPFGVSCDQQALSAPADFQHATVIIVPAAGLCIRRYLRVLHV